MQACDSCHRRKSRCDKVKPTCGFCEKANVQCTYSDRTKDPSIRKDHVEAVERRLRHAEAKNKALANELANLRSAAASRSRGDSLTPGDGPQSSANTLSGDVINEVSFLASTAAGERHYLGSTSGVLFADLVRASVNVAPASNHSTASPMRGFGPPTLANLPFSTNVKETLPPKHLARELFDNYFAHDHLCFPFLLQSSTLSIVESIYKDPSYYGGNAFEAFVFDMILAIATVNVYKLDWQMLPSSENHHARAMHRITDVLQAGGISSLQAILLLCQYRTSSSLQDTSASMWHLVGIAVRIAFELGLHRESAYDFKSRPLVETDELDMLRSQEIRRRCFWSVFTLDRVVSITLGRPLSIHMEDIDVDLPVVENDHVTNSELESDIELSFNKTAIFIHITKYRLLCGKIMRALHSPKTQGNNDDVMRRLRDDLARELNEWQLKTRELDLPEFDLSSMMPQNRSCFRSKEWYEVLYSNGMLMLFRPSPALSDISGDSETLRKLFQSSKQAILLYAYLHRSRKLNYSWITLHAVFMAGLTYLYALSRHFRERCRNPQAGALLECDPGAIEIVNDTRACSNVLVAVSERWNALRNCHEVFDKLSDAVLTDAIRLQTSLQRTPNTQPQLDSVTSQNPVPGVIARSENADSSQSYQGPESNAYGSWPRDDYSTGTTDVYSATSPLAVDSQLRNCFGDLQYFFNGTNAGDPVMELSQGWLGYIDGPDQLSQPMEQNHVDHGLRY